MAAYGTPITFGLSNVDQSLIAGINIYGTYITYSDENLKNNITEKTNYQD